MVADRIYKSCIRKLVRWIWINSCSHYIHEQEFIHYIQNLYHDIRSDVRLQQHNRTINLDRTNASRLQCVRLSQSPYNLRGCLIGWINERRDRAHDNIHEFTYPLRRTASASACTSAWDYRERDWGNRSHFDDARPFHWIRAKGHDSFEKWDTRIRSRVRYVRAAPTAVISKMEMALGKARFRIEPVSIENGISVYAWGRRISDVYCTALRSCH